MGQHIALAMIVKNEAHVLPRCLASVKPWISSWCIADTGSTDETHAVIRRELAGIPGELIERPWIGFATNRNQAFDRAETHADYVLVIDADEELVGNTSDPIPELTDPGYALEYELVGENTEWWRPTLVKAGIGWHYESSVGPEANELHEYLIAPGKPASTPIRGVSIKSHNDSARNTPGHRKKSLRDAKLLGRSARRHPENPRTWFYLARSLAGAEKIDAAINAYERRSGFDDDSEERWYALYQSAALREVRGDDWRDVARAFLRAYNARPRRAEPLWSLAALHNDHKEHALAEMYARVACSLPIPGDVQPLNKSIYHWRIPLELAVAIANQGRLGEALDIVKRVEASPRLPGAELPNVRRLASEFAKGIAA